ncbi:hypothetical protein [Glaciihabitans sp. dw_435]|uniref:hypothetical protein n=1 Tax=Glaciihabitans sp. dw_435 TaxID=2720081 RepID=UPI001BD6C75F|nr:hypothetical protein [Glaciihabitans sp. dw_435]
MNYPAYAQPSTEQYCQAPGCKNPNLSDEERLLAAIFRKEGEAFLARTAVPGSDLCTWHHKQFPKVLKDLSSLWPNLETGLYRKGTGQANTAVQTSGVSDIAQMWNPHISEVMHEVEEWLAFIVRTVKTEHELPSTFVHVDEIGRSTTTYTRRTKFTENPRMIFASLAVHEANWLSHHPTLGASLLDDALEHRRNIIRALDTDPVRRVGISNSVCAHEVDDTVFGALICMAPMVGILNEADSIRPSVVVCSAHPKTHGIFTRDQWMELRTHAKPR